MIVSLLFCGVGAIMSKGASAAKVEVGLATKTAIVKAAGKVFITEAFSALMMSAVNIGAEEISKFVMDELPREG
jgi:hypothetical protein